MGTAGEDLGSMGTRYQAIALGLPSMAVPKMGYGESLGGGKGTLVSGEHVPAGSQESRRRTKNNWASAQP